MAGISKKTYKLKNGKAVTKYTITYRDIYGKQHTTGMYDTERQAAKDLPKYEEKEGIKTKDLLFGDIMNFFMEMVNRTFAKTTRIEYQRMINNHLKPYYEIKYKKLNSLVFQELLDNIKLKTPFTAKNILKLCKSAVNYSINHKLLSTSSNIFNNIQNIDTPKTKKKIFNINEIMNILKKCTEVNNKFFPILFTFIANGLREGELFALNISDFNFVNDTIIITKQFTRGECKEPKTDTSNRIVYMFPFFSFFMEKIYLPTLPDNTKLAFPNTIGTYLNPQNVRIRYWKKLLVYCGYPENYSDIHKLRNFYINLLSYAGIAGKFAQNQAGHSTYKTTHDIYERNTIDTINSSKEKMNSLFGINNKNQNDISNPETLGLILKNIFISYVEKNPEITNKKKYFDEINDFFPENKKCEKNVRNLTKEKDFKIIQFPKRYQEL